MGAPDYLIQAVKDIYNLTPYKINEQTFFTEKGLKQGCPLSPLLFALYISDLEKTLRNYQSGGIVIGKQKICGWKEETVSHMKTNCCKDDRTWCALLNERGSGADWMREVIKRRNHS